jgi:hypothetical protein
MKQNVINAQLNALSHFKKEVAKRRRRNKLAKESRYINR